MEMNDAELRRSPDGPFQAGGALKFGKQTYIERDADDHALNHLQHMDYITLVEPRQQGKTSLINCLMGRLAGKNYQFAFVDLSTISRSSEEHLYSSLTNRLARRVKWIKEAEIQTPSDGGEWYEYLEDLATVACEKSEQLVIILDEVGAMPRTGWTTNFFSAIRSVYNGRQSAPCLENLTFVLSGAYHPNHLIDDPGISQFNVESRVQLHDFNLSQVIQLVEMLGVEKGVFETSERIFAWTAGQPFIVQWICAFLSSKKSAIDPDAVDNAVQSFLKMETSHCYHVFHPLAIDPHLREYTRSILESPTRYMPVNDYMFNLARVLGLIREDSLGNCAIRNLIYKVVWEAFLRNPDLWKGLPAETAMPNLPSLPERHGDVYIFQDVGTIYGLAAGPGSQAAPPGQGAAELEEAIRGLNRSFEALREEQAGLLARLNEDRQRELSEIRLLIHAQHMDVGEVGRTLDAIRRALKILSANDASFSAEVRQVLAGMRSAADSSLETSQKLELTLPVIPLLLDYKFEIGLDSSVDVKELKADLAEKWKGLVERVNK